MPVLIVYASEHGSTRGVAERIGARLEERGFAIDVVAAAQAPDPSVYTAVVIGSAIHTGAWLPEAADFVRRNRVALRGRPVWLFSVSSNGDEESFFPKPVATVMRKLQKEPKIAEYRRAARPRGHRNFAGVIHREDWGRTGDIFLHAFGGRNGDHRNWPAIDAWADSIAAELVPDAGAEAMAEAPVAVLDGTDS